jgi:hypothetical protein
MRNRTAFTAVLHLSIGIMTVLYLLVGAVVYAARGPAAAELQNLAANGPVLLSRTAVACVLVQTLVQLVIAVYIWTTTLVTWYLNLCNAVCSHAAIPTLQHQDTPKLHAVTCDSQRDIEGQRDLISNTVCVDSVTGVGEAQSDPHIPSQQEQQQRQSQVNMSAVSASPVVWCVGSCASIAVSALVSSLVPSVQHLAGIVGAGPVLILAYGVPCLFAAVLLRDAVPTRHRACVVGALTSMFVVSLLAGIAGVAVSVLSFVSGSRD